MRRKFSIILFIVVIVISVIIAACNTIVNVNANGRTYDSTDSIPQRKVAVLLGTNPKSRYNKGSNLFYTARIRAASSLYHKGKVRLIIISGAKRTCYDEPSAMKADLIRQDVANTAIVMDGNGHNTFLSMKNMRDDYHLDSMIVISQKWHNQRAIFLADRFGINTIGLNAEDYDNPRAQIVHLRELLARVKLFINVYITNRKDFPYKEKA